MQTKPDYARQPFYRLLGAVVGLLFVATGLICAWAAEPGTLGQYLLSIALFSLGANQLLASWRGASSWLGKIGPLP